MKKAGLSTGLSGCSSPGELAIVAHEAQQEHEHVDEIKIQVQRTHDGRFSKPFP